MRSMSAALPASAPAVTSEWPLMYFVALCITRSTPSAIGCWLTGLANVLSTIASTPRARHAAATAAISTHRSVGLIGDSNQTIFVAGDNSPSGLCEFVERHEPRHDPELRQQVREQVKGAAVDGRTADDLISARQQRQQRRRGRRLPAREQQRPLGPLEHRDLLLHRHNRRIRVARVEELRRVLRDCTDGPLPLYRTERSCSHKSASSASRPRG